MFKKSLALAIMGLFIPQRLPASTVDTAGHLPVTKAGKGQLRQARSKPSGAAQNQRAAKKRANIRKHS